MVAKTTRVFIAEDSPTTRATLKTVLQRASDMEVVGEADEGRLVLDGVDNVRPDVVLMDIGMPGMSGLETTTRLKEKHPSIKVIMVTSNETDGVVFDAFSCGADGYYLKTSNADQLLPAVRSVVAGAAWLHPAIAGRVLRACVRGASLLMEKKHAVAQPATELKKVSKYEPVCRLVDIANELEGSKRSEDADAVLEAAAALAKKKGIDSQMDLSNLLTVTADMLYSHEKYINAEAFYLEALDLRHQSLGNEDPAVASSLENLANLYDTRSNYAEAEHYYFWSLKIREKVAGVDHKLTKDTCAKLAWVYRAQGKNELAEEMDKRAKTQKSQV